MKNERNLFKTQKILSGIYIVLLVAMIFINGFHMFSTYGANSFKNPRYYILVYHITPFLILLVCNALTFHFDTGWAKILHVCTFFLQGYYSLTLDINEFYGWAISLVAILLMYKYGYFSKHPILKAILLYLSFMSVCIISVLVNNDTMSRLLSTTVFLVFILTFIYFIFQDDIKEAIKNKQRVAELQHRVVMLNMALEEQQECASTREEELQEQLAAQSKTDQSELSLRRRRDILADLAKLSKEQDQLNSQQNQLRKLETDIRKSIFELSGLRNCTDQELELIFLFYIHRGNLTNKEMAALMGTNCDAIKYRMRTIYHKIDGVDSRTGLLAYIDDNIQLKPYY